MVKSHKHQNAYKPYTMYKYLILFIITLLFFITVGADNAYAKEKFKSASASLVGQEDEIETKIDNRAKILKAFLESYDSPLAENAETFVRAADENNLDWRLVAAISGVESSFGKHLPYESYNGWGWGIYGDNMITFASYDDGIETISKGLRVNYMDKWGAQDVYQIGKIYAASPTWAQRVTYFMDKIDAFGAKNPTKSLSITI